MEERRRRSLILSGSDFRSFSFLPSHLFVSPLQSLFVLSLVPSPYTILYAQCEDRKSTPDFLTGLTNPQERKIRPGAENVPTNSVDLEDAYKRSPECERATQEMRDYEQELLGDVCPLFHLLLFLSVTDYPLSPSCFF